MGILCYKHYSLWDIYSIQIIFLTLPSYYSTIQIQSPLNSFSSYKYLKSILKVKAIYLLRFFIFILFKMKNKLSITLYIDKLF